MAVEVVRRRVRVLEEEDDAVEVDLPRRAHGLHEEPQAAADERRRHPSAVDGPEPWIVGVARHLTGPTRPQDVEETLLREGRRVVRPDAHQAVPVDGRDTGTLPDRD